MSKRSGIIVLVALALGSAAVTLLHRKASTRSREPFYEGKPLSYWSEQAAVSEDLAGEHAVKAIQTIGPKAVPYLLDELKIGDSFFRRTYRKTWPWLPRRLQTAFRPPGYEDYLFSRITSNLTLLGPAATPQLITALNDPNRSVRVAALWTLLELKQEQAIADHVSSLLVDPSREILICATLALAAVDPVNTNSLRGLIEGLKGAGVRPPIAEGVRIRAAEALGRMGPKAQAAVPDLQKAFKFYGYPAMRTATSIALWRIARDANSARIVTAELRSAAKESSAESDVRCDNILAAFADVGAPKEAVPIILEMVASPAAGLPDFARSNLVQHGHQALRKIDPEH